MFKAKKIFDDKTTDPNSRDAFIARRGWLEKFMRRHGCNACTSIATSI